MSLPLNPRPVPLAIDAWTVALLPLGEPATVVCQEESLNLAFAFARGSLLDALGCGIAILPPAPEPDWDADDEVVLTAKGGAL